MDHFEAESAIYYVEPGPNLAERLKRVGWENADMPRPQRVWHNSPDGAVGQVTQKTRHPERMYRDHKSGKYEHVPLFFYWDDLGLNQLESELDPDDMYRYWFDGLFSVRELFPVEAYTAETNVLLTLDHRNKPPIGHVDLSEFPYDELLDTVRRQLEDKEQEALSCMSIQLEEDEQGNRTYRASRHDLRKALETVNIAYPARWFDTFEAQSSRHHLPQYRITVPPERNLFT